MQIRNIGIDLGKTVFHLVGLSAKGSVLVRKRLSRSQLLRFTAQLPVAMIGMEACCGAHHLGRILEQQGHQVRLIPAQFVKPFVKSNKNDYIDAEAIAEAIQRPTMRFVPVKTVDQLDLQAIHRVRDRLITRRTAVINQLRAFLLERGLTFRQGRTHLEKQMGTILSEVETDHLGFFSRLLRQLRSEWQSLDADIAALDKELGTIAARDESCRRLMKIPGVGTLVATATVAAVGRGAAFRRGRGFASWLGLVPRQHSTGGKPKLLGISKRGNPYLRRLYIHGARSVFMHARRERHRWGEWLSQLETRTHANVAVVALANKLARIAWAVLAGETPYNPAPAAS